MKFTFPGLWQRSFPLSAARAGILLAAAFLAGCASLPDRSGQRPSVAVQEPVGTRLAQVVVHSTPTEDNAFRLLPEPSAALDWRLALINEAEHALDLQYFIWHADVTGHLLLRALRDAAMRGVRVRLLLDDLYTAEVDGLLEGLSGYPGIEVRLFNPFPSGRRSLVTRVVGSLGDYGRIRHRMHNKLLVADNLVAITGGRNIGDAYLAAGTANFFDVDILAMGPIVREMSGSFDDYWNSDHAFEGRLLWGGLPAAGRRELFASLMDQAALDPAIVRRVSAHMPRPGAAGELESGKVALQACDARLFVDPVEKASGTSLEDSSATVHQRLIDILVQAREEVYVVSPYFVRGRKGLDRIKMLHDRGVRLHVLTNSGSTNDEPLAHIIYARYRRSLIQLGVQLREFLGERPVPVDSEPAGASGGRLHAKLAIVDHRVVYIGSLNFTGRSERINTELGIVLDCPALASQLMRLIESAPAYELRLASNNRGLQWVDRRQEPERVWDEEPEFSIWQRIKSTILGHFVPEEEI